MSKYTKFKLYQKYEKRGSQERIPVYPNTYSIDGDGTMPLVIVRENDPDCGYSGDTQPIYRWYPMPISSYYYCEECPTQYRWTNMDILTDYECVGTSKYYKQKKQYTYDGTNWYDFVPEETQRGELYQTNSPDCGYVEPQYRTASGTPYCGGSNMVDKYVEVYSQVSYNGGFSWVTTATTTSLVETNSYDCGYRTRTYSGTPYCSGTHGVDKYVDVLSQISYDYGNTWQTTSSSTTLVENNSYDCGYRTRWTESGYTCVGYDKYTNNVEQVSYDSGTTWENTSNTSASTLIETDSTDCGVSYRWTEDCWICNQYDKYANYKKQKSYDSGTTWIDTGVISAGTLIEQNSFTCGYGNPNPQDYCYYAEYSDGTRFTASADCQTVEEITTDTTKPNCYDSKKMTYAYIDGCWKSIGDMAFSGNSELTSVDINVGHIKYCAFSGCTSLSSVTLPYTTYYLGAGAFNDCVSLNYIIIQAITPPTIDYGWPSFPFENTNNCPIYVPSGSVNTYKEARYWGYYADRIKPYRWYESGTTCVGFDKYVNNIMQVSDDGTTWRNMPYTIPSTLIESASTDCGVQYRTLSGTPYCSGSSGYDKYVDIETQVSYDSGVTWSTSAITPTLVEANSSDCGFSLKFLATYDGGQTYTLPCDSNTTLTSSETNPSGYYIQFMTSAVIGDCVTEIGTNAFDSYSALTSCNIPSGVTSIGESAFARCTSLSSVTIPNSVTSIGQSAFKNSGISGTLTIPSGMTVGGGAFESCSNLQEVIIEEGSLNCPEFNGCTSLSSITIASTVTNSSYGLYKTFQNCSSLISLNIPSGITSIGPFAFVNCSSLTSITFNAVTPPTLTIYNISGYRAFDNTNNCPIYVPAQSVNAYKTANNWSMFADRIQAIP